MRQKTTIGQWTAGYPAPEPDPDRKQAALELAKTLLRQSGKYAGSHWHFVRMQLQGISKVFWAIQFICFAAFLWNRPAAARMEDIQILFLTIVPIMTFFILPELLKARLSRTAETEAACFYSPARVIAAKITIISASNLLTVGAAAAAFSACGPFSLVELLCRGFIPLHLSVSLSVFAFDFMRITSPYAMLSVSTLLTVALIQLRHLAFLLTEAWPGVYLGSVLLAGLAVLSAAFRTKHLEERYDGA